MNRLGDRANVRGARGRASTSIDQCASRTRQDDRRSRYLSVVHGSIAANQVRVNYCAGSGIPMRVYIIVAGLVLSIIGRGSATVVDKGTDAQRSCELLVQNSFRNQDEARSAGACEGMIETAMLFSPNLPADVRACPPTQGSILQSAKVFLRYIDNNPDRVSEPGITIAIEAFRDAWLCHGDDAESSIGTGPKKRAPKKSKQ
jgi:hypothetical protein